jgi:HD-GYP domain-containing protein (c-di-GMP phosphodiesterase class II)
MNHVPIRINTIRPDDIVNFDVFIQVGERYIHYIRNSEPFEAERLEKLRTKGVKKMWIQMQEEPLYLEYLDMGLNRLADNSMTKEQKAGFVRDSMTTEAENVVRNVSTKEGYTKTQQRMEKVVKFLTAESNALKTVMEATGYATDGFQHAANVSSLSLSLAGALGLNKPKDLLELGLAALLHDIGKTQVGLDPSLPYEKMDKDQLAKWEKHPDEGARLLADKPHISRSILDLISFHEEKGNGNGPHKKMLSSMPLTQQVLNLCNDYDHLASVKQISPKDVMAIYFQERIGLFDLKHINALGGLLK